MSDITEKYMKEAELLFAFAVNNLAEEGIEKIATALAAVRAEEQQPLINALKEIEEIANKNGIHKWHEESLGDFIHGGGDRIKHKADYYVNAMHILRIAGIAKKSIAALIDKVPS